jgi:signal transduction histidine kinase
VSIDPRMEGATRKQGKRVVAINPTVGRYDVRVKAGPGYVTQREEAAEGLTAILQAAPQLTPILAPELARMRDWPNSEKIAKALMAMAPPEARAILGDTEDEQPQIPPEIQQQMQQFQQQGEQMAQMLDAAEQEIARMQAALESKAEDMQARLEEARIQAEGKVREAMVKAEASVQEMVVKTQGEAAVAQLQVPQLPAPVEQQPAPDPLAQLMPILMAMQQQIAALSQPRAEVPMEIIHERDPVTGLAIRSYERPLLN